MTFGAAISSGFKNYVNFTGRAVRSEFWYWILFEVIASVVARIIDFAAFGRVAPLSILVWLGLLLPTLAVSIRRMHDLDRSGWDIVVVYIPFIGAIVRYIIWAATAGTPGANRFGPPAPTGR
jgi:uncharacterized membrane protein YhaH (DUF805 family)